MILAIACVTVGMDIVNAIVAVFLAGLAVRMGWLELPGSLDALELRWC